MTAPATLVTQPFISTDQANNPGGIYLDNGSLTSNGAGALTSVSATTSGAATIGGNLLISNKKIGFAAAADFIDMSAAQGKIKLGPTSTTLQIGIAATTTNVTDTNSNNITSHSKFSGSTNAATAHNYAVATPNFVNTMVTGTATATSYGTFTATQVTPAMTSAAAYTALASLE